jgi:hypothetical protein
MNPGAAFGEIHYRASKVASAINRKQPALQAGGEPRMRAIVGGHGWFSVSSSHQLRTSP